MTTMEKLGLGIGILIALLRLPAIFWPAAYARAVRTLILEKAFVVRLLGALLLLIAATIIVLVAQTLTLFQTVMLIVAILFVASAMAMLVFTDRYRAFGDRVVGGLGDVGVRIGGLIGVAVGIWIVVLSLSVR